MAGILLYAKKMYTNKGLRDEFVEIASSVSKGMPRKTKKQFYKSLFSSTKPRQFASANKEVSSMLNKNRVRAASQEKLGKIAGALDSDVSESLNLANAKLSALEDMMKISNATEHARIRNIVNNGVKNMKIDVSPISLNVNTERIGQEVVEETRKDLMTIAKRVIRYPIIKVLSLAVPKSRKTLCAGLMSEPKELFAGKYYKRLLEQKGILSKAPKDIVIADRSAGLFIGSNLTSAKNCEGGFNTYTNTIEFTKEIKTLSRAEQAGLIEHELLHAEQTYAMIQTYGIDTYISALKTRILNSLSKTPEYKNCSQYELQQILDKEINVDEIKKAFSGAISAPKVDKNSKLGRKAKEYLEALANYVPPERNGILVSATNEYKTNKLEVEAYKKQRNSILATMILENLNLSCV